MSLRDDQKIPTFFNIYLLFFLHLPGKKGLASGTFQRLLPEKLCNMKSFRLYKPEYPECSSKKGGFAHSVEKLIVLLIFGTMHCRCKNCKYEWSK